MKSFCFLISLFLSLSVSANADLDELESIIQVQSSFKSLSVDSGPDLAGSSTISKDKSLSEIQTSIERCKHQESLSTTRQESGEYKTISFSCRLNEKEILVSESFIESDNNEIKSFQELTFIELKLTPQAYLKLLAQSEVEKVSTDENSTGGLRTLGTFARIGIPVFLALKTSRLLAPDRLDWQKHFIAGSIISGLTILTTQGILRFIARKRGSQMSERKIAIISSLAGLLVSLVAGGGKELYDSTGRGTPEWRDAAFTAAGGALVSLFFAIPFRSIFAWRPAPMARSMLIPETQF